MAWYNASWNYRFQLTVDKTKVGSAQTSFPVFINLVDLGSGHGFWTHAKTNGIDIRITKADGTTEVAREITSCDLSGKTGEVHFLSDSLSSSSDTKFYVYYGNADASDYAVTDTYGRNAVWINSKWVYHFNDANDYSGNGLNLTPVGSLTYTVGQIGSCVNLGTQAGGKYLSYNATCGLNMAADFTFTLLWKQDAEATTFRILHSMLDGGFVDLAYGHPTNYQLQMNCNNGDYLLNTNVSPPLGTTWHIFSFTLISGVATMYLDGVFQDSKSVTLTGDVRHKFYIGSDTAGGTQAGGYIDEARLFQITSDSGRVTTENNNLSSSSTFYALGSEQTPTSYEDKTFTTDCIVGGLNSTQTFTEDGTIKSSNSDKVFTEDGIIFTDYFDSYTNGGSVTGTSLTYSHTCSNIDRILFVGVRGDVTNDYVTGVTYNGVSMTLIDKDLCPGDRYAYFYYLKNPASGANNVVVSASQSILLSADSVSYFDIIQSGGLDNQNKVVDTYNDSSLTVPITTVADNCIVVGMFHSQANATAGSNTTLRSDGTSARPHLCDSGTVISPAGSTSLSLNWLQTKRSVGIVASFATQQSGTTDKTFTNDGYIPPPNDASITNDADIKSLNSEKTFTEDGNIVELVGDKPFSNDGLVLPANSSSITITEGIQYTIYQRHTGNVRDITIAGTYTGSPTTIEARVLKDDLSSVIVDWTTIVASPTGGVYSGVLTAVPQGGWYRTQVRFSNDVSKMSITLNIWGIGAIIGITGQSNAQVLGNDINGVQTQNLTRKYTNRNYPSPGYYDNTATGTVALANQLMDSLNIPVLILSQGINSTPITDWNSAGGYAYSQFKTAVTTVGGELEAICYLQGEYEADPAHPMDTATYTTNLNTLISLFRSDITWARSDKPIVITQLDRHDIGTDSNWEAIKTAQKNIVNEGNYIYGFMCGDVEVVDGIHYQWATWPIGAARVGERLGLALLYHFGLVGYYKGPTILHYSQHSSTEIDIVIQNNGGTDFVPISGITGFEVFDNSSPKTISSTVRINSTTIRLTVSSPIVNITNVRYMYGTYPPDQLYWLTGPVRDNTSHNLPLQDTSNILGYIEETFTNDGILKTLDNSKTFTEDAIIRDVSGDKSITEDAIVQSLNNEIFTTDAMVTVNTLVIDVLAVGGGAGGGGGTSGNGGSGGGGAGGYQYITGHNVSVGSYAVTVGNGGTGGNPYSSGDSGGDSVFDTITANGGGSGGNANGGGTGGNGGCGGGGGAYCAGGTGSQGGNGGSSSLPLLGGGGGGGANGNGSNNRGAGGDGLANSISGVSVTYAGGGGGGYGIGAGGTGLGGAGGGGNGGADQQNGSNGTDGLGGGGGGGAHRNPGSTSGGNGGSGVVIIRYLTSDFGVCTGGIKTVDGSYTVHTFTSNGTMIFTAPPLVSFTNDGILKEIYDKDFTTDGYVKFVIDKTFTVDAVVKSLNDNTFTNDGVLKSLNNTHSFFEDGILKILNIDKTFTEDGVLQVFDNDINFTVDGLVYFFNYHFLGQDGIIFSEVDKMFTEDGYVVIRVTHEETFTNDGIVKIKNNDLSLTEDAEIKEINELSFSEDGDIKSFDINKTFTNDGISKVLNNTKDFTEDGILKVKDNEIIFTEDASVKSFNNVSFTNDADVEAHTDKIFTTDGIVLKNTIEFTNDAIIISQGTSVIFNGLNINGVTYITENTSHDSDPVRVLASYKIARRDGEKLVSAYWGKKEITINGYIQDDNQQEFELDVDIFKKITSQKSGSLEIMYNNQFRRYIATVEELKISRDSYNIDWSPFSIKFLVPDGKGYDTSSTIETYSVVITSGSVFAGTFYNDGTADAFPTIRIQINSLSSVNSFYLSDGIRILTITNTFHNGDIITIDFLNFIIKLNIAQINSSGAFPLFPVGGTNFRLYTDGTSSANLTVSFIYDKAYL